MVRKLADKVQFPSELVDAQSLEPMASEAITYRPLSSLLSEPISLLHCEEVLRLPAFKQRNGRWASGQPKKADPNAERTYSVRLAAIPFAGAVLYLFENGKERSTTQTDEQGVAVIELPTNRAITAEYVVSLTPNPNAGQFVSQTPFSESFMFSLWNLTCRIRNKTDRWWRFVGRSYNEDLPSRYWKSNMNPKAGLHTIGLAAPSGMQSFMDAVPTFGDNEFTLEYGISAYCNTVEPFPTRERCQAARLETWWDFEVVASNGKQEFTARGDLNIDRHLKITLTSDSMTHEVIKPEGAVT